jgi:hypothetical protein
MWVSANYPGSWHDSRIAYGLYTKLRTSVPEGFFLVADTAFPHGDKHIAGKIQSAMKEGEYFSANRDERDYELARSRELLSYRQTAEWGNRHLQGCFGRLRVPLPADLAELRSTMLEVIFRLSNVRTRLVGINQIKTVYERIWREGQQEDVWSGFEQMMYGEQRRRDRVHRFHVEPEWH